MCAKDAVELDAEDDCNCVNCRLARLEAAIRVLSENITELVEHARTASPPKARGKA